MKNILFSSVKNFRFERKFYIEDYTKADIEILLKHHPAMFREIYCERTVNNIYFDSFNLQHYFDNVNGVSQRLKVRVRWYGDLFGFVERPILEFKLKHNFHVGKLSYPLKPFTLDNKFSLAGMHKVFNESDVPDALKHHLRELNFSILNSYRRKYFLSSDKQYRITTDVDLEVYKLSSYQNNFLSKVRDKMNVILELKYNLTQDQFVHRITNYFPFRMTRNSKYVDGIAKFSL